MSEKWSEYMWLSEEGDTFYVTSANGQARKQEPDTPTEPQPLKAASKKLRPPTLPELCESELPPTKYAMQPYRTGAMATRRVYRKPENLIREEYIEKHGKEPSAATLQKEVNMAHKHINRSAHGRKYEHSMAQVFYNEGLTPFIGAEYWSKDGRDSGKDQVDLYVAGLAVECKSFKNLEDYSVEVEGELYLFVCSAYSFNRKSKHSDFYLLGYKDTASRVYLSQTYKLGWVDLFAPVVVPVNEVELVRLPWTSPSKEKESGMFVKASEVIGFKTLVTKLKQHREALAETSRKLSDTEVIRLLYPYLKTTEQVEKQREREREREQLVQPYLELCF